MSCPHCNRACVSRKCSKCILDVWRRGAKGDDRGN